MGYVEIIRDGLTLRLEDDKRTLTPSIDLCVACNDDRLIHSGNFLKSLLLHFFNLFSIRILFGLFAR